MEFLRNTFAIMVGIFISGLIISLGIRITSECVIFSQFSPFEAWKRALISARDKELFFIILLISFGIGATVGGVATAIMVRHAKVAYAILIGFILLFLALLDIIIFPYHPTFYKISIFFVFFPFSWIGGKIVEITCQNSRKRIGNQ